MKERGMAISGERIDLSRFRAGWALTPVGSVAHHISRDSGDFGPACGAALHLWKDATGFVFFEPGNYPRCKRCARKTTPGQRRA